MSLVMLYNSNSGNCSNPSNPGIPGNADDPGKADIGTIVGNAGIPAW